MSRRWRPVPSGSPTCHATAGGSSTPAGQRWSRSTAAGRVSQGAGSPREAGSHRGACLGGGGEAGSGSSESEGGVTLGPWSNRGGGGGGGGGGG